MADMLEKLAAGDDKRPRRRDQIDLLLMRLEHLVGMERMVMEMRFRHGLTFRQLELLTGEPRRKIAAGVKGLTERLMAGDYLAIIGHGDRFSEQVLRVAYDHYLLGLGYRRIAAKQQMTTHRVRAILRRLQRWKTQHAGRTGQGSIRNSG